MRILLLTLPLFANNAYGATCNDLKTCAKVLHELHGQHYIWDADSEKKVVAAPDLELTKESAETVFTALLDQHGLARAPVGDGKTFRIVRGVYRKEMELPIFEASAESKPNFPNNWDWVAMRYKAKSRELAESIPGIYLLHVPREARIHHDYNAGVIIVEGNTPLVRHMYEIIKTADVPMTAAIKEHLKDTEQKWNARMGGQK